MGGRLGRGWVEVAWRGPGGPQAQGSFPQAPLEGQQASSEWVPTSENRIAKPGGSLATLLGSNPSHLCGTLGKPLHLSVSQLIYNILRADINVYLIKLLRRLTSNPHNLQVRARAATSLSKTKVWQSLPLWVWIDKDYSVLGPDKCRFPAHFHLMLCDFG